VTRTTLGSEEGRRRRRVRRVRRRVRRRRRRKKKRRREEKKRRREATTDTATVATNKLTTVSMMIRSDEGSNSSGEEGGGGEVDGEEMVTVVTTDDNDTRDSTTTMTTSSSYHHQQKEHNHHHHRHQREHHQHNNHEEHMGYIQTLKNIVRLLRLRESPESPFTESFKRERSLATTVIPVLFVFLLIGGGIDLGFNGLKPALIDSRVYFDEMCLHSSHPVELRNTTIVRGGGRTNVTIVYCDEQLLAINQIFQVTAAALNTSAFFVGVFIDVFGKRKTMITALLMWVSGLLLFAFSINNYSNSSHYTESGSGGSSSDALAVRDGSSSSAHLDLFVVGLVLSGVGGALVMFVGMRFKDQLPSFPGYGHFVEATFTLVWDLSSFVFLVFAFIYFSTGASLRVIICTYSIVVFVVFFTFSFFKVHDYNINYSSTSTGVDHDYTIASKGTRGGFVELQDKSPQRLLSTTSSSLSASSTSSYQPHEDVLVASEEQSTGRPLDDEPQSSSSSSSPTVGMVLWDLLEQMVDIAKQITELRSIALTFAMGMGTTLGYFYMSSLFEQLLSVTSDDFEFSTLMLNVFSILLPVEALPETFVVSYLLHRFRTVHSRYRVLALVACVWVSLTLIHDLPYLQLLTFVVFIQWRSLAFATLYSCVTTQQKSIEAVHQALMEIEAKQQRLQQAQSPSTTTTTTSTSSSSEILRLRPEPPVAAAPQEKKRLNKLDAWGSRAGLSLTVGGLLAFSIIPLNRIVIERMNGDFKIMNLSLLAVYCLACSFVEFAFHFYKTPDEKLLEQLSNGNKLRPSS